jgi:hypothetical protein
MNHDYHQVPSLLALVLLAYYDVKKVFFLWGYLTIFFCK